MIRRASLTPVALVALALARCTCEEPLAPPPPPVVEPALASMAASEKADLQWKRGLALQRGLAKALELPLGEVCNELGRYPCIDRVHQVALGGNDPFEQSLYEPIAQPSPTTAIAFDRVILSACTNAVEREIERGTPGAFRHLPLTTDTLDTSDPAVLEGADTLIRALYERIHARTARQEEVDTALTLLDEPMSGIDFSKLACFAIAGTTENLFY